MDEVYRSLLEAGWKMTEIDNSDFYDLLRLLNKEEEPEVADENDQSAFSFLP